jgi:FAD synthase
MHKIPEDFYGETLKVVLLGEIRKMTTFKDTSMSNEI